MVWIDGFQNVQWGTSFGCRDNSFMRALSAALEPTGKHITYEEMMGMSGMAFRLHFAQPPWCPTGTIAGFGYDCSAQALHAVGCELRLINVHGDAATPENIARARQAVIEEANAGRPALYCNEECGLIVGYRGDATTLVCRHYAGGKPGYAGTQELPWSVGVIQTGEQEPDKRQVVIESLRTAITLHNTSAYGHHPFQHFTDYASGAAAYDAWASALLAADEDVPDAVLHTNAHTYGTLTNARTAAATYLKGISSGLGNDAADHLNDAAGLYDHVRRRLFDERDCVADPWRESWTEDNREAQADLLQECKAAEAEAVAEIERALAVIE